MAKEYIIYCDESVSKGRFFSNFYGGVLIASDRIDAVRDHIGAAKQRLNLGREVKWQKVGEAPSYPPVKRVPLALAWQRGPRAIN